VDDAADKDLDGGPLLLFLALRTGDGDSSLFSLTLRIGDGDSRRRLSDESAAGVAPPGVAWTMMSKILLTPPFPG
jgi:hypothetical protein